ncbi:MAG: Dabb family protein [Pseudomonadota bacterium]
MIHHIVLTRYKSDVTEEEKQGLYAKLDAIVQRLEGAISGSYGRSVSPEGLENGFLDGFVIDFASKDAVNEYLVDEEHKVVGAEIASRLEGGTDGLVVFDIEV